MKLSERHELLSSVMEEAFKVESIDNQVSIENLHEIIKKLWDK